MFDTRPGRQPRRDRLPDHPHAARARASRTVAVYLRRRPRRPARRDGRRGGAARAGARRATAISTSTRSSTRRASTGAEAIHPGYGFLSEDAAFAAGGRGRRASPSSVRRPTSSAPSAPRTPPATLAEAAGVPLLPGTGRARGSRTTRSAAAERIGYPVMLKATAGGGGIGMERCDDAQALSAAVRARAAPGGRQLRRRRRFPRALRRRAPATSRCRSSATARAGCSRSATATARSSAATRR